MAMTLGQMLMILRTEKLEMSQQQVAELLNIDRSTYGYYELDKTQPSYQTLARICDIFDVSYNELLDPIYFNESKSGGKTMIQQMTKSERQIMELLWQSDRPLSCAEIVALSEDKTWKDSYVHSLLKSLMKKGIVRIDGYELIFRSYARKFAPAIRYDEYVLLSGYTENQLKDADRMLGFIKTILTYSDDKELKKRLKGLMNSQSRRRG